jgi:dihydrofolate reductase
VGRIVVTEFVSLDGVIEDPGGAEDFRHGGWSFEISRGDEGDKFKLDEAFSSGALLLGRVTYEGFAEAWPSREGEFADKFNTMPKYVVSSTLEEPEWNNSTVLKGDVSTEVAKLKQEQDGDIVVHGSARLVQTLIEHDLVDEFRLEGRRRRRGHSHLRASERGSEGVGLRLARARRRLSDGAGKQGSNRRPRDAGSG